MKVYFIYFEKYDDREDKDDPILADAGVIAAFSTQEKAVSYMRKIFPEIEGKDKTLTTIEHGDGTIDMKIMCHFSGMKVGAGEVITLRYKELDKFGESLDEDYYDEFCG